MSTGHGIAVAGLAITGAILVVADQFFMGGIFHGMAFALALKP